ncbi:CRISPR-associated endonuclease Cas2 [Phormidium sp. CCY1219]|uniref:CRISPR-associated endonuclease Cas2 n=1 Tax=Phormidium sp. CCY1219 TaxID=2886104 RepID=UPI002D1E7318|nr:CRISPR-associated endonuclease Cas2 [Phormidium sp. CCY1219]MEB3827383.1 CRISPR-associated endonuclease Cas2 [Phormidium sp. CCY1219]
MLVLVVYDIPDDRRRLKLAAFLEGYGRRVQKSVFECFLSLAEMQQLHQKMKHFVKLEEDDVRLYWIGESALAKTLTLGSDLPQPPPVSTLFRRSIHSTPPRFHPWGIFLPLQPSTVADNQQSTINFPLKTAKLPIGKNVFSKQTADL